MLELIAALGAATWAPLWLPVALWTVVALVCWYGLSQVPRLHPQTQYSARLALLASLPVGVGLTWLLPPVLPASWLPGVWSTSAAAAPARPMLLLPPADWAPVATVEATEPLSVPLLLVGGLTVLAATAALLSTVRLLRDAVAVQRLRRDLLTAPGAAVEDQAQTLAPSLRIRRPVQVRLSDRVPVPLTCGTWQPLVVLPRQLAAEEQRLALLHELLHVRRYDYLLNLASRALVALCAVHPLMHRLYAEACTYREVANDDAVLHQPGVDRQPYATLLLRFADAPTNRWAAALSFAQPIASLKDRIYAMSQPPAPNRPRPIFTLLLALLLVSFIGTFMACSDVAVDAPSTTEEATLPSLEDATIVEVTGTMPQPVGGMEAIAQNIDYPDIAQQAGIEGRVIVQFVVDAEGNVRNPEVVRGLGAGLDEAAVAALEATEWKAGEQNGEPVHVQMAFPMTFRLSDAEGASQAPPPTPPTPTESNGPSDADVMSQPPPPPTEGNVFTVVEEMPAPVGGMAAVQQRVQYPDVAKRAGIEGRVVVQFVVDTDGTPRNLQVVRGIGGGADEEALRVIQETTFTPGMQRGQAVPVRLSWPITFRLPENEGTTSRQTSSAALQVERMDGRMASLPPEAIASIDVTRDEGSSGTITLTLKEGMALDFFDGETFAYRAPGDSHPTTILIRRG